MPTAVETKEAPKAIVDTGLLKVLQDYDKANSKVTSYFARVCDYVKLHKLSRSTVMITLKELKPNLAETTLNSEASRIMTFQKEENAELLEEMKTGRKTVSEARSEATRKQLNPANKKKSEEEHLRERLFGCSRYALSKLELTMEEEDEDRANEEAAETFLDMAKDEFGKALKLYPIFKEAKEEESELEEVDAEA